jgi:pSer/pThr/pTyr-binding forkhead associated (FHA) protein
MAMDVLERLNRRFGSWYEGLFGGSDNRDLRPRDVLRRILAAMEDHRREGLDGRVYVPNVYTLQIVVMNDDERHYLRTFLSAEELAAAVAQSIEQHNYSVRGNLLFTIEEADAKTMANGERIRVRCRFDAAVSAASLNAAPVTPSPGAMSSAPASPMPAPPTPTVAVAPSGPAPTIALVPSQAHIDEPKTVPAVGGGALASLVATDPRGQFIDAFPIGSRGAAIGRGRMAGNDIILDGDTMISKRHARIVQERGDFVLYDENSTNGTFLNEQMLRPGAGATLRAGDIIRIGETQLKFQPPQSSPQNYGTPRPPSTDPTPEANADTRQGRYSVFRLVTGDGEAYTLASQMTVGRAPTGDIMIIGNGVATHHARIETEPNAVYVIDLGTPGGTMVNGERIPPHLRVALYNGDTVAFGDVFLRLERVA